LIRLNIPKISGIYKIESIINGKIYVGSAVNLKKRKQEHFYHLKLQRHHSILLQRHYNKYGEKDLKFHIIEFCEKEKLIEREQYYLDTLKTDFNICKIAGSSLGTIRTEEQRQNFSGPNNPMYGKKRVSPMDGKKHSDETRKQMSESHLLHPRTDWKPRKKTEKEKKELSIKYTGENNPFYKKTHTEKTKQILRELHTGTKHSEETKQKQSKSHLEFYKTEKGKQLKEDNRKYMINKRKKK